MAKKMIFIIWWVVWSCISLWMSWITNIAMQIIMNAMTMMGMLISVGHAWKKTSARPILMLMLLKKNVTHKKMKHTRNWKMKLTRKWNSQENKTHKKIKLTRKWNSQENEKVKKTRLTRNWTKIWLRLVWSPTRLSRGRSQCRLILNFIFFTGFHFDQIHSCHICQYGPFCLI